MSGESVVLDLRPGLAILRLARPAVHNVVDDDVVAACERHLDLIESDPERRVIVISGAGSHTFSAGSDLNVFADLDLDAAYAVILRMRRWLERLAGGDRVTIAALNGDVFGGGCELALACHLRIAAAHARLTFRQASMGLVTGWGGGARLFQRIGAPAALRLLLTGESVDAHEAFRLGLVDRVVPAERLMDETLVWAERILAHPAGSVRAFLELARAVDRAGFEAVGPVEARLFEERWGDEEFRERLEDWHARRRARKGESEAM